MLEREDGQWVEYVREEEDQDSHGLLDMLARMRGGMSGMPGGMPLGGMPAGGGPGAMPLECAQM